MVAATHHFEDSILDTVRATPLSHHYPLLSATPPYSPEGAAGWNVEGPFLYSPPTQPHEPF